MSDSHQKVLAPSLMHVTIDADINLQMSYWVAELTNLAEVTHPLWDYIQVKLVCSSILVHCAKRLI